MWISYCLGRLTDGCSNPSRHSDCGLPIPRMIGSTSQTPAHAMLSSISCCFECNRMMTMPLPWLSYHSDRGSCPITVICTKLKILPFVGYCGHKLGYIIRNWSQSNCSFVPWTKPCLFVFSASNTLIILYFPVKSLFHIRPTRVVFLSLKSTIYFPIAKNLKSVSIWIVLDWKVKNRTWVMFQATLVWDGRKLKFDDTTQRRIQVVLKFHLMSFGFGLVPFSHQKRLEDAELKRFQPCRSSTVGKTLK